MTPKKRSNKPAPALGAGGQPGKQGDAQGVPVVSAETDVERADSNLPPGIASVEAADPPARRIDIEHGGLGDANDVERGSA